MQYRGKYPVFDLSKVRTYPLKIRPNKVELGDFVNVKQLAAQPQRPCEGQWFRDGLPGKGPGQLAGLKEMADIIVANYRAGRPVAVLSGAHMIKNGQIPIIIDLIERGVVTLYSTNMAGAIHSFELALMGSSSESVRDSLPTGDFGMAFETGAYLNETIRAGFGQGLGLGESLGKLFCDAAFRRQVIDACLAGRSDGAEYFRPYDGFAHADSCVFAAAYRKGIPACVHASLGTDIIDQQPGFDGQAKGACSGADFLMFCQHMCRFTQGGVILNIGTAIMGPEIVLKAVSMAANVGCKPDKLVTGDFDVRPFVFDDQIRDEKQHYYYFRDQKSIATRIPKVFGGTGYYFQGLHEETLTALYQLIVRAL